MTGNNLGGVLTGSRMLFALAENGELPRFFATIHPRYRTPSNPSSSRPCGAGPCLSGSFVILAVPARSPAYHLHRRLRATLRLRHPRFQTAVSPATL